MKFNFNPFVFVGIIITFPSCAPVFSDMQSARTAGKGNIEITPTYSIARETEQIHSDYQNQLGFQAAYGISSRFDVRLRYEHIWDGNGYNAEIIAIAPKYSLTKDLVAFTMPIGRAFGKYMNKNWQIQPTFLFTIPAIKNKFEINFTPKGIFSLTKDQYSFLATNIGIAFGQDIRKCAFRLEYGKAMDMNSYEKYYQFGLGFTYIFSTK